LWFRYVTRVKCAVCARVQWPDLNVGRRSMWLVNHRSTK
jgi:hypothetical protein